MNVAYWLVRLYQKTLSLDHGPLRFLFPNGLCRYYPSCSEYAAQALKKHGLWKGGALALKRLARCHPWARHGHDPVP
jgi:putative membrane protein insertion efficiency factor